MRRFCHGLLGGNNLSGEIPTELGGLASLGGLGLDYNELTGQLPVSFLDLSLTEFHWQGNAGLCAPATAAFRTWLGAIGDHEPGPYCSDSDRDAPQALYDSARR